MTTKNIIFIAAAGCIGLCAWIAKTNNDISKTQWLVGTWENKTSRGSMFETWYKLSDKELKGKSYMVKEKDTMVFENLQLLQEGEKLFYIPMVKNQNNGLPVRFAAKTISNTQLIFENPQHDFPQVISYTKIHADSLVAEISGTKQGKERKQTFWMKRVK